MEVATIIRYDTLISSLLNPPPDPEDQEQPSPENNKKDKENSQELENLAILLSSH